MNPSKYRRFLLTQGLSCSRYAIEQIVSQPWLQVFGLLPFWELLSDLKQSVPELTIAYKKIEDTGRRSEQRTSQGWALRKFKPHQAFNPNQVTFLRNLFNEGEQTGRKHTAKDASVAIKKNSWWWTSIYSCCIFNRDANKGTFLTMEWERTSTAI